MENVIEDIILQAQHRPRRCYVLASWRGQKRIVSLEFYRRFQDKLLLVQAASFQHGKTTRTIQFISHRTVETRKGRTHIHTDYLSLAVLKARLNTYKAVKKEWAKGAEIRQKKMKKIDAAVAAAA